MLLLIFAGISLQVSAQQWQELVYLKNGSIIKGIVIEQVPSGSMKVQTSDGSIFVYPMSEVERIVKEYSEKENEANSAKTLRIGYKWFLECGYLLDNENYNHIEAVTSHGYQFSPYLYIGGGLGYESFIDILSMPMFANVRLTPLNKAVTPYLDVKLGYALQLTTSGYDGGGLFFSPTIGCRIGVSKKSGISFGLGYQLRQLGYEYSITGNHGMNNDGTLHAFGLKISFDF